MHCFSQAPFVSRALVFAIVFSLVTSYVPAQGTGCKVLCVWGDVSVQKNQKAKAVAVKVDARFEAGAAIKVGTGGGYLSLLWDKGRVQEMSKPGVQILVEPTARLNQNSVRKVVGFVANALKGATAERYVGSVYRGVGEVHTLFPQDTRVIGDSVLLVWRATEGAKDYIISLYDATKRTVATINTKDTSHQLNLYAINGLKPGDCYYWNVSTKDRKPDTERALCLTDRREADSLKMAFTKFSTEQIGLDEKSITPMQRFLCGAWYEREGYLNEALIYYTYAHRMQPGVPQFKGSMDRLLSGGK